MAARKKTARKGRTRKTGRAGGRKSPRRRKSGSTAVSRLEIELPSNLRQFERRVRRQLNQLEKQIERTGARARRRATKMLREASQRLGRLQAQGERGWRRLDRNARREAVNVLRRLEKAVDAPPRRKARRKKA